MIFLKRVAEKARPMVKRSRGRSGTDPQQVRVQLDRVLREMLAHFRRREEPLRRQWMKEMETRGYLRGGTSE
ncbi:MAG: hypothetical protein ACREJ1_07550, partial [Candidatus Methylomirabilales bacterium]